MEMEVTWSRAAMVWWSYIWRLVLATIVSSLGGGVLGLILGAVGAPKEAIIFVTLPIGLMIGTAASIVPMKMILGKDFGEFRLLLVAKQPQTPG
jgi:Na+/citrate or Na+/malate symporter